MSVAVHFSKLALLLLVTSAQGYKVNITKVGNCPDVQNAQVNITGVQYDYDDEGLCDTVHGTYFVHSVDPRPRYELYLSLYQCSSTSVDQCNDNEKKYVEPLHCVDLHGDFLGPWSMIAKSMLGSKCGEMIGEFGLKSAKLLTKYLTKYLVVDPVLTRHRIKMILHKIDQIGPDEYPRACINLEFSTII